MAVPDRVPHSASRIRFHIRRESRDNSVRQEGMREIRVEERTGEKENDSDLQSEAEDLRAGRDHGGTGREERPRRNQR